MTKDKELKQEKNRIIELFKDAPEEKIMILDSLIEQAAVQRILLRDLNKQALKSGLVSANPKNPKQQKKLPVGNEISRHGALLTNIMDKLMKHLAPEVSEDDDGFDQYDD